MKFRPGKAVNKFHPRWITLRGFFLYWYWSANDKE